MTDFKVGDTVRVIEGYREDDIQDTIRYAFTDCGMNYFVLSRDYDEKEEKWVGLHGYPYREHELELVKFIKVNNWKKEMKG